MRTSFRGVLPFSQLKELSLCWLWIHSTIQCGPSNGDNVPGWMRIWTWRTALPLPHAAAHPKVVQRTAVNFQALLLNETMSCALLVSLWSGMVPAAHFHVKCVGTIISHSILTIFGRGYHSHVEDEMEISGQEARSRRVVRCSLLAAAAER